MINSERLTEYAAEYITLYGDAETFNVREPVGVDEIPDEWGFKLGVKEIGKPWYSVVENVHLCGPALVGMLDGDVVLDTAYYGRIDLFERNKPYFDWAMRSFGGEEAVEIECGISLGGVWSSNYFHHLMDTLPRLEAFGDYVGKSKQLVKIILPPSVPAFVIDSLDHYSKYLVGADGHQHYLVKKLIVPATRRRNGFVPGRLVEFLVGMYWKWNTKPNGSNGVGKRLFIGRDNAETRRVRIGGNKAFARFMDEYDVHIVYPEKYSFHKQVKMFSQAELIIGAHGSGLANMVWAHNPKVIELVTPEYTNPCCWLIAASQGWDYGYVVGKPVGEPGREDMEIDLGKLEQVMDMLGVKESNERTKELA